MHERPEREFIRHTIDVPLEVRTLEGGGRRSQRGYNVSSGGLAFESVECIDPGTAVELRIPTVVPVFEAKARVVWCRPEADHFLVGVRFLDPADAFRSRMVQQVCAIEHYRKEIRRTEGRALSTREAAAEWIERYAGRFPATGEGG